MKSGCFSFLESSIWQRHAGRILALMLRVLANHSKRCVHRLHRARFGLGVPAGLFVPSLLTGAVLGRWVGEVLSRTPEWLIPGTWAHPSVYALVGASAMLAGVGRTCSCARAQKVCV